MRSDGSVVRQLLAAVDRLAALDITDLPAATRTAISGPPRNAAPTP